MRTSTDEYITKDGKIVAVSQDELPPEGSRIWNGYDYKNQYWVFHGERDTRTIEELRQSLAKAETGDKAAEVIAFADNKLAKKSPSYGMGIRELPKYEPDSKHCMES